MPLIAAACFVCACTGDARALSPATPEQVLCASDFIVEATVTSASAGDCSRLSYGSCIGGSFAIVARIDRVVASRPAARGGSVRAVLVPGNELEFRTTHAWIDVDERPPTKAVGGDAESTAFAAALTGRTLIFKVLRGNPAVESRIDVQAYGTAREAWIRATLQEPRGWSCPELEVPAI